MKENDITDALCGRIDTADILPAYMPNVKPSDEVKAATTYFEVTFAASRTQRAGYDATSVVQKIAILQCAVVVPDGTGVTVAEDFADNIKALFTASPILKLPINCGQIIIGTVDIKPGFNADGEYRVPVHIPFIANQT
jgi:hypothetical protein|tara:strand:+ start:82 stop:495 length:414 start_codon:yes stop_codon:yes gene_type:complete